MIDLLKQIFSLRGLQQFLRVRDDEGNPDRKQIIASLAQVGMLLLIIISLWLIGIIG